MMKKRLEKQQDTVMFNLKNRSSLRKKKLIILIRKIFISQNLTFFVTQRVKLTPINESYRKTNFEWS